MSYNNMPDNKTPRSVKTQNPVESALDEATLRCAHFQTVLMTNECILVKNSDIHEDPGVFLSAHLLFNEEGIIQGCVNFNAECLDPSPRNL